MTSGTFDTVLISSISIDRAARQRRELKGIEELAASIARSGLINPITVDRDLNLIAGERRLTACKHLGLTHIAVQFADELDEEDLQLIELEENVRRQDLTWQEQTEALANLHRLQQQRNPEWKVEDTASATGLNPNYVRTQLAVAKELSSGNELIKNAATVKTAQGVLHRQRARAASDLIDLVHAYSPKVPLVNASMFDFLPTYKGAPFNFIHCDFPYGINFQSSAGMNKANAERYDDTPEVFQKLLLEGLPLIPQAEQCHLMFWFSMRYYAFARLTLKAQGWTVFDNPLIWHKSDNSGIMPDPKREGRRNYEVALMAYKGDRQVVQPVSNIYAGPKEANGHPSAKPREMLKHFFRMFVDNSTIMIDPTCGSGNSVRVAKDMHAASVLGIEMDKGFYTDAVNAWEKI